MRIAKISDRLYRVYNNGKVKDVWIEDGEIKAPENKENILTPTETLAIEMEIF
jgi:hypothetical protein